MLVTVGMDSNGLLRDVLSCFTIVTDSFLGPL